MKLLENIRKNTLLLRTFGWTFLWGVIAHGYCYFNLFFSHDNITPIQDDGNFEISLGRFLQPKYVSFIRGYIDSPTLIGMCSLLFLAVAIYAILKTFEIENPVKISLTCGILATFSGFTCVNATYIGLSDIFMLSFMLVSLGVLLFDKYRYGFVLGAFLIGMSLALYQPFIQAAVALLIALVMKQILDKPENTFKENFMYGLKAVLTLFLALGGYYCALRLVLHFKNIDLYNSYNGIATVGQYSGIKEIADLFVGTYVSAYNFLFHPAIFHYRYMSLGLGIILLFAIIFLVLRATERKIKVSNSILLGAMILLLPFGANIVHFISKGTEHWLVVYSLSLFYIFSIMVCPNSDESEKREKKNHVVLIKRIMADVMVVSIIWTIFNSIVYSNQAYEKKHLVYQNTMLMMNRITDEIEHTEGYIVADTPVAFVGNLDDSSYHWSIPGFDELTGTGLTSRYAVTYYSTYYIYYNRLTNCRMNIVGENVANEFALYDEVAEMPIFPYPGYCKMVGDTLVVKLSE